MIDSKRYLEEVRKADDRIDRLRNEREELAAKAMSLGSMASDGRVICYTELEEPYMGGDFGIWDVSC